MIGLAGTIVAAAVPVGACNTVTMADR